MRFNMLPTLMLVMLLTLTHSFHLVLPHLRAKRALAQETVCSAMPEGTQTRRDVLQATAARIASAALLVTGPGLASAEPLDDVQVTSREPRPPRLRLRPHSVGRCERRQRAKSSTRSINSSIRSSGIRSARSSTLPPSRSLARGPSHRRCATPGRRSPRICRAPPRESARSSSRRRACSTPSCTATSSSTRAGRCSAQRPTSRRPRGAQLLASRLRAAPGRVPPIRALSSAPLQVP